MKKIMVYTLLTTVLCSFHSSANSQGLFDRITESYVAQKTKSNTLGTIIGDKPLIIEIDPYNTGGISIPRIAKVCSITKIEADNNDFTREYLVQLKIEPHGAKARKMAFEADIPNHDKYNFSNYLVAFIDEKTSSLNIEEAWPLNGCLFDLSKTNIPPIFARDFDGDGLDEICLFVHSGEGASLCILRKMEPSKKYEFAFEESIMVEHVPWEGEVQLVNNQLVIHTLRFVSKNPLDPFGESEKRYLKKKVSFQRGRFKPIVK